MSEIIALENNKLKMNVTSNSKNNCCGCGACADVCPCNAIEFNEDKEGFVYPFVDDNLCVNCGKCLDVCNFNVPDSIQNQTAFGVKMKDLNSRLLSRSGGVFYALSEWIIEHGGIVYGAAMQNDFSVIHTRVDIKAELNKLRDAKYVQSSTSEIFKQVANDLSKDKLVLFSGTPCQVSGLLGYLKERNIPQSNLYTCDLICHGVPSPKVWQDYILYIEKKKNKKILSAKFRDKEYGWEAHFESFVFEDGTKIVSNDFSSLFYEHLLFRPSCYNCKFANLNRIGDLTLGDFWGIEKHNKDFDDNKGVSLVLINTFKGKDLFSINKEKFDFFEVVPNECLQPTLIEPSTPSPRRNCFWDDYNRFGFDYIIKKYTRPKTIEGIIKRLVKKGMYKVNICNHP